MCDAFSNKSAADGRRTVKYELAALLQMEGRSRRNTSHCSHTAPFDPTVEENFGMIKEGCDRGALFGESDLIAV
jgi:hypothetical protein